MQGGHSRSDGGAPGQPRERPVRAAARGTQAPHLQAKLQQHIDREDYRIKSLTESILYRFLPAALRAIAQEGQDPLAELSPQQYKAVACAALAVATLLNAPPGFLEFLLCMPWNELPELYAACGDVSAGDVSAAPKLKLLTPSSEERAALVNTQLDAGLLDCVMDFLYKPEHAESLPPLMALDGDTYVAENGAEAKPLQRAVRAQLEGCTALHCAAARGNPALVDALLLSGADPLIRNALREGPVELVPKCGDTSPGRRPVCRCMGHDDQLAWECRSRLARLFLVRRCVGTFKSGLWAWLQMCVLCVLCMVGLWGCPTTLLREDVEELAATRWKERRKKAKQAAQATLLKLRSAAAKGKEELDAWAAGDRGRSIDSKKSPAGKKPPDPDMKTNTNNIINSSRDGSSGGSLDKPRCTSDINNKNKGESGKTIAESDGEWREGEGSCVKDQQGLQQQQQGPAARAFIHFSAAVKVLLSLEGLVGGPNGIRYSRAMLVPQVRFLPREDWEEVRIGVEEVAAVWSGLAASGLAKYEACGCGGCAAVAANAINSAIKNLMEAVDAARTGGSGCEASEQPHLLSKLGSHLATAVHARARLLLKTDVQQSPTRASIWKSQQCVAEWSLVRSLGANSKLAGSGGSPSEQGSGDPLEVQCLESWAAAAAADVLLVEALLGTSLPLLQPLSSAVPQGIRYDVSSGGPCLNRPVTKALLQQLEVALKAAKPHASDHIVALAEGVAKAASDEIAAGDRLREMLLQRAAGGGASGPSAEQLAAAVDAASRYPSLKEEVAQAEAMRERWAQRAAIQRRLDESLEAARAPAPLKMLSDNGPTHRIGQSTYAAPSLSADVFWSELKVRTEDVEAAVEEARQASISVARARKVLKDLQAQGVAVEAAGALDEALQQGKAGSASLKAALSRAEDAATAAASGAGDFAVGSEYLAPRLVAARAKLGLERASEALARAVPSCRGVADLPKLEAAILTARKLGAHELDPAAYAAAKDLRAKLDAAAKARANLESAVRQLQQRQGRVEDISEAEKAIAAAADYGELLAADVTSANEAVNAVQAASAAEAKLARALQDGVGVAALSLTIKEAAATGVKVTEARRILKLMQNLETAVAAAASEGPAARHSLQGKISAAAAGGVPATMVAEARHTLHRLLLADVRAELDAALRVTRAVDARPPAQRLATLRSVLERVDAVLALEEDGDHEDNASSQNDDQEGADDAQQAQQGPRPVRTISDTSTEGGHGASTPPLQRDVSVGGNLLRTQGSFASQPASSTGGSAASTPTWSQKENNAKAGSGASIDHTGPPHPHSEINLAHLGDCAAIVLCMRVIGDLAAVWFEPQSDGVSVADGDDSGGEEGPSLSASLGGGGGGGSVIDAAGDDEIAIRRMARQARRRLEQEEREQARLEREKAEEGRLRRELNAREKAAREAAEKERADKARAERAERMAALEAQKAERRERERAVRAERERQRQEREEAAREHFLLLQRRRRMLAEQARATQIAQLLAAQQAQQAQQITMQHQQQQSAGLFPPQQAPLPSAQSWEMDSGSEPLTSDGLSNDVLSATGVLRLLDEPMSPPANNNIPTISHHHNIANTNAMRPVGMAPLGGGTSTTGGMPLSLSLPMSMSHSMGSSSMGQHPGGGLPTTQRSHEMPAISSTTSLLGATGASLWSSTEGGTELGFEPRPSSSASGTDGGPGQSVALFGDLGGASWLSSNPVYSSAPTSLAPPPPPPLSAPPMPMPMPAPMPTSMPRHASTSASATGQQGASMLPTSLLWSSADLGVPLGGVGGGRAVERPGSSLVPGMNASGLWSSTGSDGAGVGSSSAVAAGAASGSGGNGGAPPSGSTTLHLDGSLLHSHAHQQHQRFHQPTMPIPGMSSSAPAGGNGGGLSGTLTSSSSAHMHPQHQLPDHLRSSLLISGHHHHLPRSNAVSGFESSQGLISDGAAAAFAAGPLGTGGLGIRGGIGSPLPATAMPMSGVGIESSSIMQSPPPPPLQHQSHDDGLWSKDRGDESHPQDFRLPSETSLFSDFLGDAATAADPSHGASRGLNFQSQA